MTQPLRSRAPLWASLFLLLTFVAAQPLLAEHIHVEESDLTLCELCFNHMPAAVASKFKFARDRQATFYRLWQTPPALDAQPAQQNARSPPRAPLSIH
ncbi:MAG: hypothetical protein K0U59_05530 [Gammaproteobacteria bacterium]|nr:hypothetical protein [Gammaproteobacteria bacterium]